MSGGMGYRGMYAKIVISRLCREESLKGLKDQRHRGNVCPARALRAPGALLLDYVPPEEPPSTPLGNALRIR